MSLQAGLITLAALAVLCATVLACLEAALSRISPPLAASLAEDGRRGAAALGRLVAERARPLNLLLLLRTGCEIAGVVAATVVLVRSRGSGLGTVAVATAGMSVLSYVLIGVAARTLGQQHAQTVALGTAPLVSGITRIFGPLPRLLIALGNVLTPGRGFREGPFATEAELRALVELAEQRGEVDAHERALIDSALDLGDTLVREVMVPRPDIVFVERGRTVRQGLNLALRSGFSRIPVIGDSEDDVVGVVFVKDLARRVTSGSRATAHVEDVMRPASFVPDSKPVGELLRQMQAGRVHLAVVVDEYGGTAGLITIEDMLEELVGEITDEYDRDEEPVEVLGPGRWRVTARLPIDELGDLLGVPLTREGVDSVGGLLAAELGRVPIPGAAVAVGDGTVRLVAESAKGRRNRIGTVLVTVATPASDGPVSPGGRESAAGGEPPGGGPAGNGAPAGNGGPAGDGGPVGDGGQPGDVGPVGQGGPPVEGGQPPAGGQPAGQAGRDAGSGVPRAGQGRISDGERDR